MREVVSSVVAIRRRRGLDICFRASLQGVKLSLSDLGIPERAVEEFTKEEDEKAERAMKALIARKQAEAKAKNG